MEHLENTLNPVIKPIKLVQEKDQPKVLLVPDDVRAKLSTMGYLYLQDRGWFSGIPVDDSGYKPWFTYPAVEFLEDIITRDTKVFEYGSGYGTLYLKRTVNEYASVEHDQSWEKQLREVEPQLNVCVVAENEKVIPWAQDTINEFFDEVAWDLPFSSDRKHDLMHGLLNREFAGYASEIAIKEKGYFDIIVVDGMARSLCGYLASKYIADKGIIILDNSDRWHYNHLQKYLIESGFGRIDFWGLGPGRQDSWCTSFFSKGFAIKNKNPERKIGDDIIFT